MDITEHPATAARRDFDDCATAALLRVASESGKTLTEIASAMGYTESHLKSLKSGGQWSAGAVVALAAATGQRPASMLAREELP